MIRALGAQLHRDRRRILLVTAMAYLAGALFYLPFDILIGGVHIALVTGAIYAGVVGCAAVIVCLLFPAMRFMIEAIAVSRLILSCVVFAMPQLGGLLLGNPLLTAFVIVTGGTLVSRLLHGRFLRERGGRRVVLRIGRSPRHPARLRARPWQHRLVTWLDDTQPIPA